MASASEPGPRQPDVGLVVTAGTSGIGWPVVGWTGEPGLSAPVVLVDGERKRPPVDVVGLLHDRKAWDTAWAHHGPRVSR